jgi:hypothetical protein
MKHFLYTFMLAYHKNILLLAVMGCAEVYRTANQLFLEAKWDCFDNGIPNNKSHLIWKFEIATCPTVKLKPHLLVNRSLKGILHHITATAV